MLDFLGASPELLSLGIFLAPFCAIVIAVFSFRVWGIAAYLGALSGRAGTLFLGFAYILQGLNLAPVLASPDQLPATLSSLQGLSAGADPVLLPFGLLVFVIGSMLFIYTFLQGKPAKEMILESLVTIGGFVFFFYLAGIAVRA
jgi:hypothetical protein